MTGAMLRATGFTYPQDLMQHTSGNRALHTNSPDTCDYADRTSRRLAGHIVNFFLLACVWSRDKQTAEEQVLSKGANLKLAGESVNLHTLLFEFLR